jgi:hypothetical protein
MVFNLPTIYFVFRNKIIQFFVQTILGYVTLVNPIAIETFGLDTGGECPADNDFTRSDKFPNGTLHRIVT